MMLTLPLRLGYLYLENNASIDLFQCDCNPLVNAHSQLHGCRKQVYPVLVPPDFVSQKALDQNKIYQGTCKRLRAKILVSSYSIPQKITYLF